MENFNGKLSKEQYDYLKAHGLSEKKLAKLKELLDKHKEGLTDYVDLVGDDLMPGPFFFHNMEKYGNLIDLDPEKTFSERENKLRAKVTLPIVQKLGKYFLSSKQVFEDRNKLLAFVEKKRKLEDAGIYGVNPDDSTLDYTPDKGIELPDEPAIWTLNHGFKDDVLASVLSIPRPFSMFFGSVPQFYNTFDGVLAYYIGSMIVNRKSRESRLAGLEKCKKAMEMGLDVLMSPEGVWNKNPHKLLEHFWPGVYRIAKANNAKVVPIIHYIYDPTQRISKDLNPIHTVVDDPIDITSMPEKEALEYYRDRLATWYYIMMEKYGQSTRKELLNGHEDMASAYDEVMQGLMATVDRYDIDFEKTITYHPKGVVNPQDVFRPIAEIEPTKDNVLHQQYAKKLVKTRDIEDYQGRF